VLIGVIHALGLSFFPQATLVLVFLTMAVVLVWRPQGLAGSAVHVEQRESVPVFGLWPLGTWGRALFVAVFVGLTLLAWRQGQPWLQRLEPLGEAPFRIESAGLEAGALASLDSLHPAPLRRQRPGPGELEIAVEATGLNFRDVLNGLGLLAAYSVELGLAAGAQMPYGGECVGRVVAVGEGIDPSLVGSRQLAALAVGSLASHVVCRSELCVPLPESMDPALGASLSTAFLTAIYGLQTLAGLQPGETVLIHAAAGGVGQAALQVARRCGARVFATASAAKQAGLLAQGVEAVFESRSLDFAAELPRSEAGKIQRNKVRAPYWEGRARQI
jgi:hypothetical protein